MYNLIWSTVILRKSRRKVWPRRTRARRAVEAPPLKLSTILLQIQTLAYQQHLVSVHLLSQALPALIHWLDGAIAAFIQPEMEILLVRIIRLPQFYRQIYLKPQCSRHYQISPQVLRNPIYPSLIHFDPFWSILIHFDPFWSILIHFNPFSGPPLSRLPRSPQLQSPFLGYPPILILCMQL